jgi:hypothetical protein
MVLTFALPPIFRMALDLASNCPVRSLTSGFASLETLFAALAAALAFALVRALAFVMTVHCSADQHEKDDDPSLFEPPGIFQISSKFMEIVLRFSRQGNNN